MAYAIRYRPDTDLGRRFTGHGGEYDTREEAEALLRVCVNAASMEVVDLAPTNEGEPS